MNSQRQATSCTVSPDASDDVAASLKAVAVVCPMSEIHDRGRTLFRRQCAAKIAMISVFVRKFSQIVYITTCLVDPVHINFHVIYAEWYLVQQIDTFF
jgi:hypothetical protein